MKLAISNIAWDQSEDDAVAQLMQQYGFTGLDVAPGKLGSNPLDLSATEIEAYIAFWQKYDVQIVGMQSLLYGHPELKIFEDASVRQQTGDYLKQVIDLASHLGVKPMVFGSPKNRQRGDLSIKQAHIIAVAFFTEIAEYACEKNTLFCLEPNPVQYNADYINTTAEALELIEQVNHPCFRLHLDSAIMTMNGEDIEKSLDAGINWLAHFHLSEPQLGAVRSGGEVNQERFIKHLDQIGYDGWLSIEMRGGLSDSDTTTVEQALAYIAGIVEV